MAITPPIFLVILFLPLLLQISPSCSRLQHPIRANLVRVDSGRNLTKLQSIQRSIRRGEQRLMRLVGRTTESGVGPTVTQVAPVHAGEGEFIMELGIGTPRVAFPAIVDTGSDLIWTQCEPCEDCYKQSTPIFDPSKSGTFKKLPCSGELCDALPTSNCENSECRYSYSYGDNSNTQGYLATETISLGTSKNITVPDISFGCGQSSSGAGFTQAAGLVGLGRGPLSLVSQLELDQFSYCLTNFGESKKSPLLFGSLDNLNTSAKVHITPLLKNPRQPSFYYLNLTGITVGTTLLRDVTSSTFSLAEDGSGGLIIDSGTSITYLERKAYAQVKKAFLSQIQMPVADESDIALDVCFTMPTDASTEIKVPKLKFHFEDADLNIPAENYMVVDGPTGLLCLAMMGSDGMSIFGNFQQQNMQIVYDLKNEKLSFAPMQCDKL